MKLSLPAFDEIVKADLANDRMGHAKLVMAGRAFLVDDGTRVLVIDREMFKREVRVLEGPTIGQSGWIYEEDIRP